MQEAQSLALPGSLLKKLFSFRVWSTKSKGSKSPKNSIQINFKGVQLPEMIEFRWVLKNLSWISRHWLWKRSKNLWMMKSLSRMGCSTIGGGSATAPEVTTCLPEHCLGAIKGREKLLEFNMKKIKRFNLWKVLKEFEREKLPSLKNQQSWASINFSFAESLTSPPQKDRKVVKSN